MSRSKKIVAQSATPLPSGSPVSPAAESGAVPSADPVFWESHVAARMGLAREKISALRAAHLAEGVDFTHEGNSVVLTPVGLGRLQDLLDAEAAQSRRAASLAATDTLAAPQIAPTATESPSADPSLITSAQPQRARVVVVRALGNPHLIYARPVGAAPAAAPLLVRVKDNRHFHPRLAAFECTRSADGMWYYLGRLPRALGRW